MTTETYLPPSIDPGQRESLSGTIQFIIDKLVKQDMDNFIPVQVVAYNRAANRVTVQIMITMINTLNEQVIRAQIASVPVLQLGGGGYVLSFPIAAGDFGWLKTTDVDMSLFLNSLKLNGGSLSAPNTFVRHKFDSSMYIPDTMFKGVTIAGGDAGNVVLQNLAGTVKVSLGTTVTITPSLGVGAAPRTGAIIDAQSTTQAIGFPAMSTSQKGNISSPQLGYTVFDTTENRLSTYTSTGWS